MTSSDQRGRVIGLGGIFFKSEDAGGARAWYTKHLGLEGGEEGAMLPWREKDSDRDHVTVWSVFPKTSDYFEAPFMVNYIVDDLDALLERLAQDGVRIDEKRMDQPYGRFAWIYDPDGSKIELWEPKQ